MYPALELNSALASYRYPRCPNARHLGHPSFVGELTSLPRHLGHPRFQDCCTQRHCTQVDPTPRRGDLARRTIGHTYPETALVTQSELHGEVFFVVFECGLAAVLVDVGAMAELKCEMGSGNG